MGKEQRKEHMVAVTLLNRLEHINFNAGMDNDIATDDYKQLIADLQQVGGANGLDVLLDKFEPQESRPPEKRTRVHNLTEIDWMQFPEELRPS